MKLSNLRQLQHLILHRSYNLVRDSLSLLHAEECRVDVSEDPGGIMRILQNYMVFYGLTSLVFATFYSEENY